MNYSHELDAALEQSLARQNSIFARLEGVLLGCLADGHTATSTKEQGAECASAALSGPQNAATQCEVADSSTHSAQCSFSQAREAAVQVYCISQRPTPEAAETGVSTREASAQTLGVEIPCALQQKPETLGGTKSKPAISFQSQADNPVVKIPGQDELRALTDICGHDFIESAQQEVLQTAELPFFKSFAVQMPAVTRFAELRVLNELTLQCAGRASPDFQLASQRWFFGDNQQYSPSVVIHYVLLANLWRQRGLFAFQ